MKHNLNQFDIFQMATPMKNLMLQQGINTLLTLLQNAPQIPDKSMTDWRDLRSGNYALVDKSLFVHSILTQGPQLMVFARPPKWGKTVAASMLSHFFDCPINCNQQYQHQERQRKYSLFFSQKNPLLINQHKPFVEPHFMKYIVLNFSFKNLNGSTPNSLQKGLKDQIQDLYKQHEYLSSTQFSSKYHKNRQDNNRQQIKWPLSLFQPLCHLIEILSEYHQKELLIIFDDYDAPIITGYFQNQEDKLTIQKIIYQFIRALSKFEEVYRLIAFGTTNLFEDNRIKKQYYRCNTTHQPSLCQHLNFGFTKEQVNSLVVSVFRNETKGQKLNVWLLMKVIEALYGGYKANIKDKKIKSKQITMFNPYSVLQYLKDCSYKQKIQFPYDLLDSRPRQTKYQLQSMQRYFKKLQNETGPTLIEFYSTIMRESTPSFGHSQWIDLYRKRQDFQDNIAYNVYNMVQLGLITQKNLFYAIPNQEKYFYFKSQLTQFMQTKIKEIINSFQIDLTGFDDSSIKDIQNICHKIFNDFIRSYHSQDVLCPLAQRDLLITIINFLYKNQRYKSLRQYRDIGDHPALAIIPIKQDLVKRKEDKQKSIIIYNSYSVFENDNRIKKRDQAYFQFLQRKWLRIVAGNDISKTINWKSIILRIACVTQNGSNYLLEFQQSAFSRGQVERIIYCSQICFKMQKKIESFNDLKDNIKEIKQFAMCHDFETMLQLLDKLKHTIPGQIFQENQRITEQLHEDVKKKKKQYIHQLQANHFALVNLGWMPILRESLLANRCIAMLIEDDLIPYVANQKDRYAIICQIQSAYDKISRKLGINQQFRAIINQHPLQKLFQWVYKKLNNYELQEQLSELGLQI